ncbi:MAG: hypothetical protein AAFX06_26620 [Planctomycetota bacterium]
MQTYAVPCLILSVVALSLLLWALFIWIRRSYYTRERFAFAGLSANTTLVLAAISTIGSGGFPWEHLFNLWRHVENKPPIPLGLTPVGSASIVALVFISFLLVTKTFNSWNGGVSKTTSKYVEFRVKRTIVEEAFEEAQRLCNPNRTKRSNAFKPTETKWVRFPDLGAMGPRTPWRERARELAILRTPSLKFEANSFNREYGFWLGHDADSNLGVALCCADESTTSEEILAVHSHLRAASELPGRVIVAFEGHSKPSALEGLVDCVELTNETEMLEHLIDFSEYIQSIKHRVCSHVRIETTSPLIETYVPPSYETKNGRRCLEAKLMEWIGTATETQLAILGEYGQGKSTAALMFTHQLLQERMEGKRIPILIELRGLSPKNISPGEMLAMWGYRFGIDARSLTALHEAGRLVIIFEGFDEMSFVGNVGDRLKHFQSLWQFNHEKAKLLFTGRPNLFLDDREMKASLGILRGGSGRLKCESVDLSPFSFDDIESALRTGDEATRQGILAAIKRSENLFELASRPSILCVFAVLWQAGELSPASESITSAEVLQKFIDSTLRRQSEKAALIDSDESEKYPNAPQYMVLTAQERRYFMMGIAVLMMSEGGTNQISSKLLDEATHELSLRCPDSISTLGDAVDGFREQGLSTMVQSSQTFQGRLQDDVRTCGVLVSDGDRDGQFRFGHKSFLEFFVADYCYRIFLNNLDDDVFAVRGLVDVRSIDLMRTSVTRTFFGELIIKDRIKSGTSSRFEIAKLLFESMVSPSLGAKVLWAVSAYFLRVDPEKSGPPKRRSRSRRQRLVYFFCYDPIDAMSRLCFSPFLSARRRPSAVGSVFRFSGLILVVALVAVHPDLSGFLFDLLGGMPEVKERLGGGMLFVILDTAVYLAVLACQFIIIYIWMYTLLSLGVLGLLLGIRHWVMRHEQMAQTWVAICFERGCSPEEVYSALRWGDRVIEKYSSDPLGLVETSQMLRSRSS